MRALTPGLALGAALLLALPAQAATCLLTLPTGGALGLSPDASRMGSEEPGGGAGSITVAALGDGLTLTFAPVLDQYPGGFDAGGADVQVAYSGTALLGSLQHGYSSGPTSTPVPNLLSLLDTALIRVNTRIISPDGFAAGTYRVRVVVTCS
jgi:hypothetical protein